MKKILIAIITFMWLPLVSSAADYDIKHFYIDATLQENGDMDVQELVVMKGTFNGYEVGIEYNTNSIYGASYMDNVSIYGGPLTNEKDLDINNWNFEFSEFKKVDYAQNGDKLKFIESNYSDSNNYRLYYSTDNSTTAFLVKYTLKDVGIAHNDCIEINWNFFSTAFRDDVEDLQIRVNYPIKMNREDFSWWFHGPLTGSSDIVDVSANYTSVLAKVKNLDAGTAVDFRTLVPKNGFNESLFSKTNNDDVKESIIESEDARVAKDNALRKKYKAYFYTIEGLSIGYYVLLIGLWIYVYKKYDKERKPKFVGEYNREFIDDYNVEVIDYLMNNTITPNAMSASLMNLIYKKNVSVEKLPEQKNNYKFTLINRDNLNDTENCLVDFLFTTVGGNNEFTTKELKSYASSTKTCNTFMSSYTKWKNKVIEDGKNQGFFDKLPGRYGYGFFMLFLAFIIYFASIVLNVDTFIVNTLIFVAIIFIVYIGTIKRKSEKGIEHYTRWKAFKKFLNDFGTFDTKELPEIILWERYLVYATIFGLAKKVQKDMNVKIKEIELTDTYYGNNYIFINDFDMTNVISSSLNEAFRGAQTTINREMASSSSGSFGGHGGGFSSGGGFGGGGRSGGGF